MDGQTMVASTLQDHPVVQPVTRDAVEQSEALRKAGRFDAADGILRPLLYPHPAPSEIMVGYALNAAGREDWEEALRRWGAVAAAYPALHNATDFNRALILRRLGRIDDADALLDRLNTALPDDPAVGQQWSLNPHYKQAWAVALDRWEMFRARWPDVAAGYAWASGALRELGRLDEATALLEGVRERFAGDIQFEMETAVLLGRRGNWAEALRKWDALHTAHPADLDIVARRTEAQLLAGYARLDAGAAPPEPAAAEPATTAATTPRQHMSILFKPAALVLEFESIGSDCEVGLLQRRYGGEPLGLLRWGGPTIDDLIVGLRHRFEGLGEPGTLRLEDKGSEYLLHDDTYKILMHTFISIDASREEKILQQLRRRMGFLKRILIDQIAAASRIFVFKDVLASDHSRLRDLHREMRGLGPATLLVVQKARTGHPATDVEQLDDGLFLGYLSAFGNRPLNPDGSWNIPIQEWITLFRIVYAAVN